MTSTIPAHMLAEAPRVWIDRGRGQILRAIDPAWLRKTAKAIANAEARNAIDEPLAPTGTEPTPKASSPLSELERVPAALRIVDRVLSAHGVSRDALFGSTKTRTAVAARSEASYRLFAAGHSYSAIGRMLKRDRTTIMYAIETWPERARKLGIELAPLSRIPIPPAPETPNKGSHGRREAQACCERCPSTPQGFCDRGRSMSDCTLLPGDVIHVPVRITVVGEAGSYGNPIIEGIVDIAGSQATFRCRLSDLIDAGVPNVVTAVVDDLDAEAMSGLSSSPTHQPEPPSEYVRLMKALADEERDRRLALAQAL